MTDGLLCALFIALALACIALSHGTDWWERFLDGVPDDVHRRRR